VGLSREILPQPGGFEGLLPFLVGNRRAAESARNEHVVVGGRFGKRRYPDKVDWGTHP